MRIKGGTVGLAVLAMLLAAPAASASTASLRDGSTVVYVGDAASDTVTVSRYVDTRGNGNPNDDRFYYVVTDNGIQSGDGCFRVNSTTSACRVSPGLKSYDLSTGDGADRVTVTGATSAGRADLGAGNDRFTGLDSGASADAVTGGAGDDTLAGGAGDDPLGGGDGVDVLTGGAGDDRLDGGAGDDHVSGNDDADAVKGGAGNDQVAGQAGDDGVDGGAGDDSLEFGAVDMAAGAGVGADRLRGGDGVDRLSYNDHPAAILVTLDEQPGDGSEGEGDNVHADIETIIGTTLDDVMTGDDAGQDLYGHAGHDRVDGRGGDDLVNGGTGPDILFGGPGSDAIEGSADGDYLDGGTGYDYFVGDNPCSAAPCTGGADDIRARDGEEDSVICGVGADRVRVDAVDAVAVDAQDGCESIDRAAAPAVAPGPQPQPQPQPLAPTGQSPLATAPAVAAMRVLGALRLRSLLKRGLAIEVTCPGPCNVEARLFRRRKVVAFGRRSNLRVGAHKLTLKARRAARRPLRRRKKAKLTLVVDVVDGTGAKTTLRRSLAFKR